MDLSEIKHIEGAGGKGGGGNAPVEAPNTLSTRAVAKAIDLVSEGPIAGICGGARGIYINDTPLMNASGIYNFARTAWDYRTGLPDQDYIPGFESAETEFSVGVDVTVENRFVRTTTEADVDAVKVTIALTEGLYEQNLENGDMNGTTVQFAFDHKLSSDTAWVQAGDHYTVSEKTTSVSELQYRIERPAGSGAWDVRARRLTPDSTKTTLRNKIAVSRVTEVKDVKLPYNNSAYVGLRIDAESVGNQIPKRSYLVKGLLVQVPSNYDPETRTYSGAFWNGTFKYEWTDNPAWCLYELLTNPLWGMNLSASLIDKFSFYDAAVYNDGLVPDGRDGLEPRFTFNAYITERTENMRLLQMFAGAMRGTLIYMGGLVTLLQDRPTSSSKLITKANVISADQDGQSIPPFVYRSTKLNERHTAFNVTFNDRADKHMPRVVTVEADESEIDRYGYVTSDIAAFGATSEGQAIRHGKWALETEINQTEIVQFKMSTNGFDLKPWKVVTLWDEDYTSEAGGGRLVSVDGTEITLDREVEIVEGAKLHVMLSDGTIEQRNVVGLPGSYTTITVAAAVEGAMAGEVYLMELVSKPRHFRVISMKQEDIATINVEAVFYDAAKYTRVEEGVNIPAPVFSAIKPTVCTAPSAILVREINVNDNNVIARSLLINWQRPSQGVVGSYNLKYRANKGGWVAVTGLKGVSHEISPAVGGEYEIQVSAVSIEGFEGPAAEATYLINTTGGELSPLQAPTGLTNAVLAGTTFADVDLHVKWTNPLVNGTFQSATLRDFEVRVIDASTSTTLRTEYVAGVAPAGTQGFVYSYSMNLADGGPRRSVHIEVRCRDANNNLSDSVAATFTNPSPAVPSDITLVGGIRSVKATWTMPKDSDFAGALIWRSTASGFSPSPATLVYQGSDSYVSDIGLTAGTTYFYRFAAYDAFMPLTEAGPVSGTGLTVSAQYSATAAGITAVDITGQIEDAQIAAVSATKILGAITSGQLEVGVRDSLNAGQQAVTTANWLNDDLTNLSNAVTRLAMKADSVDGVLREVGVLIDPQTGGVTVSTIDALTAKVDGNAVVLATEQSVRASETGDLQAKYTVKTDINGYVSGFGLASTANDAAPTSAFTVRADSFSVASPAGPGITPAVPFFVQTTPTTINGVAVPVGVYMDSAVIRNGDIVTAKIADAAIVDAKIGNLSADKITFGTMSGDRIESNSIVTGHLVSEAVTTDKIQVGSITAASGIIANAAIDTAQLKDASITVAKIADLAVETAKIGNVAITSAKIADLAVTDAKVANAAITTAKIANLAVDAAKIADAAITSAKIADASITTAKIGLAQVDTLQIKGDAVTVPRYIEVYGASGSATFTLDAPAFVAVNGSANVNSGATATVAINGTTVATSKFDLSYSVSIPFSTTNSVSDHSHSLNINENLSTSSTNVNVSGSTGFSDGHTHSFSGNGSHSHGVTGSVSGTAQAGGGHSHSLNFPSVVASVTGSTTLGLTGYAALTAGTHTVACSGGHGSTTFKLGPVNTS